MLKIKNYTKKYGDKTVVDDLSLTIEPGEIYGFIGNNGAGKTTTIKACVGILKPDGGEILINGKNIAKDPIACKKEMAYIPDNPELYEYMSGNQYLNFVADIYGVDRATRQEQIQKYGELFGIDDALNRAIGTYSHGMKQKVALMAGFIHEPKLIIMDEPFVGLDPQAAFYVKEIMREFCKKGSSIFFSTHVLEVAEKLCDHIAIIKKGKLLKSGTMEEVSGDESLESVFLELEAEKDALSVKVD